MGDQREMMRKRQSGGKEDTIKSFATCSFSGVSLTSSVPPYNTDGLPLFTLL